VVAIGTSAIEFMNCFINQVRPTRTTILAGITLAAHQFHRTVFAAIFWFASAKIVRPAVSTYSVFARIVSFAFVDFMLAVIALVTLVTFAGITADTIHADARPARIAIALVDIYFAILASNTLYAEAFVSIEISKI